MNIPLGNAAGCVYHLFEHSEPPTIPMLSSLLALLPQSFLAPVVVAGPAARRGTA